MSASVPCAAARRRLMDILEGPVDGSISSHVAGCEACSRELQELRETLESLQALADTGDPSPGPDEAYWSDFNARLHRRIDDAQRSDVAAHRRGPRHRPLPLASAAAMIIMAGAAFVSLVRQAPTMGPLSVPEAEARLERALRSLETLPSDEAVLMARVAIDGAVGGWSSTFREDGEAMDLEEFGSQDWSDVLDETITQPGRMWSPSLSDDLERLDGPGAERLRNEILGDPC